MTTEKFKWQAVVARYAHAETWRSIWQVINSLVPFIVMWYLMYRSVEIGYWLTLILAVPTAGFMVRLFIIFHDCCHGSFLRSMKANAQGSFKIYLKYQSKKPSIIGLKRISKPGLRVYARNDNIPRVLNGLGTAVISTSKGVVTDREARKLNVGGEVLCYIW